MSVENILKSHGIRNVSDAALVRAAFQAANDTTASPEIIIASLPIDNPNDHALVKALIEAIRENKSQPIPSAESAVHSPHKSYWFSNIGVVVSVFAIGIASYAMVIQNRQIKALLATNDTLQTHIEHLNDALISSQKSSGSIADTLKQLNDLRKVESDTMERIMSYMPAKPSQTAESNPVKATPNTETPKVVPASNTPINTPTDTAPSPK